MESSPPSAPNPPYQPYAPYPQVPGQFPYAGAPSVPLAPGYPYAPYPQYPGVPSTPLGATSGNPAYLPPAPYPYPGYPTYPGYSATPSVPLNTQEPNPYATVPLSPQSIPLALPPKTPNIFGQQFSRVVSASIAGGALLFVALSFLTDEALARADWSDSAIVAAIVAFVLAGLTIVGASVRVAVGRRVRSMLLLALALTLVLSTLGAIGLIVSDPLHGIQAHALEQGGHWEAAITEYTLAGEVAPNAPGIARVHDEWGEQLLARHSYPQAIDHFSTVINTYYRSDSPLDRAYKDQFNAYREWFLGNTADIPYYDMLNFFGQYRQSTHCDASCSAAIDAVEPQALYQYAMQLMDRGNYSLAVVEFQVLQTRYPTSPYSSKAHTAAAQAYYQRGQQEIHTDCASAVSTYQTLVKDYADTPEAKKAKAELAAPQDVTGYITGFPAGVRPLLLLSRSADTKNGNFSGEYRAAPDSGGNFTFSSVAQGDYNLAAIFDQNGWQYWIWSYDGQTGSPYAVHVGPLCPVDYGAFEYVSHA